MDNSIAHDNNNLVVVFDRYPGCVRAFMSVKTTNGFGEPYSKWSYFDIAHIIALISSLKLGHFCSATVSTLEL